MANMANKDTATTNTTNPSIQIYDLGRYDSRTGNHSYTLWTTGWNYAVQYPNGEREFFGSRYYPEHDRVEALKGIEEIPKEALHISWEEMDDLARGHLSRKLGFPLLTENEARLINDELDFVRSRRRGAPDWGLKVAPGYNLEGSLYTREQTLLMQGKHLPCKMFTPIEGPLSEEDYYVQRNVDESDFPGGKHSLYLRGVHYVYFSVGWNRGSHYETDVMLTPWEETRWGSRSNWLDEQERIRQEKEAEEEHLRQARQAEARKRAEDRKEFARECGRMAKRMKIPFGVVLAFKKDEKALESFRRGIVRAIRQNRRYDAHELCCGRGRAGDEIARLDIPFGGVDANRIKGFVLACLEEGRFLTK